MPLIFELAPTSLDEPAEEVEEERLVQTQLKERQKIEIQNKRWVPGERTFWIA
jgi:hypothetical protein